MKKTNLKKLSAFIIMMMFSFTFASAQICNGNKIRVYKCQAGVCNSKCVNPNNIPAGWNTVGCGAGCGVICNCRHRPVPFACGAICGWRISSSDNDMPFASFITSITPNPVSKSTTISFSLEQSEKVSIKIFDMTGRIVKTLADGLFAEGENKIEWNVENENPGMYFLRMEAGNYSQTEKISVIQ
jgi:hypothetical protein